MSKPTISNDTRYAPALAGVHHLKLPVSDLARSRQWYRTRLGYEVTMEFVEQGRLMGYVLEHPNGGPQLALRLAPVRARAAAGFDYFAIGVPGKTALDELAVRLTALGEDHDGVHFASIGWVLPHLHDPDGHEVRFYTIEQHTDLRTPGITTIEDPRETSERDERDWRAVGTAPGQRRSQLARCRHVVAAAAWGLRWGSFRVSRAGSCQGSTARRRVRQTASHLPHTVCTPAPLGGCPVGEEKAATAAPSEAALRAAGGARAAMSCSPPLRPRGRTVTAGVRQRSWNRVGY